MAGSSVKSIQNNLETFFILILSLVVFILFFLLTGANGLVVGNDPAVHLLRTNMILETGQIPLGDIAWYPPLYHIILAAFIAFTGITNVEQMLILIKIITALFNCLLFL